MQVGDLVTVTKPIITHHREGILAEYGDTLRIEYPVHRPELYEYDFCVKHTTTGAKFFCFAHDIQKIGDAE